MTFKKSWRLHALHIINAIDQLYEFQKRGDIAIDELVYAGTLRNLHTISESVGHIPSEIKAHYSHILWREIAGFRNYIVHDYLGENINFQIIQNVIKNELPPLKLVISEILVKFSTDNI